MSLDWKTHTLPISVVASIFFDQQPYWIRYHERKGIFDGIGTRRPKGDRQYTLDDIRLMAVACREYGVIDDEGLRNCIERIEMMSKPVFKRRKER